MDLDEPTPPEVGEEARVAKVDENRVVLVRPKSTCATCSWVYDENLTLLQLLGEDGTPVDAKRFGFLGIGMKFLDFPLEVKKSWRIETHGLFRGNSVPYVIDSTVTAFENVKTKAGTFKAFKIDRSWTIKVSSGTPPAWSDTAWFSPEVKTIVKFETGSQNGRPFELTSYSVKP